MRAGTTQRYLHAIELGRTSVGLDVLTKLASALSADVADLVGPSAKRRTTTEVPTRVFNQLSRAWDKVKKAASGEGDT